MAKEFKIRNSTAKFEGKREIKKLTDFYNLDTTIPVGYRVKSICTTQFRQWCTYVLCQFAIKDYMINKSRCQCRKELLKDMRRLINAVFDMIERMTER
ncbi:RhuM family protein [uncultured Bacteroides sp.]|uniref:RhuM family protein n=1 Tax=uncultured Bacteroides sp. TaxID=162156 RepID=UPI0026771297|nr:RhuM family protein [uncultured Bacteroides sp.]